jgi:hypothetical protein
MKRTVPRLSAIAMVVAALAALVALVAPAPSAAAGAMVRVVHASPDAPGVDVYVDGQRAVTNLQFKQATDYAALPAGGRKVQVFATGTGPSGRAVIDATLDLADGRAYTVAAVNTLARLEALVLTDDLSAPAAGKAHLRVVHAAPDAPAVDVAVRGGPVVFSNAAFKAATRYTPVDAGSYAFEVRPTGTPQAVLTTPAIALGSGGIYTVFALGQVSADTLTAVALVDSAPGAMPGMPNTGSGGMAAGAASYLPLALLATLALGLLAWTPARRALATVAARRG